jgi:hypothetical protein
MNVTIVNGVRVLEVPAEGPPLGSERDATDLIGAAYGQEVDLIAVPVARLHADFLKLRTGMAGAFLQKMQNYSYRCAIVGDISAAVAASSALRDFVYESNKIGQVIFVDGRDELSARLGSR